MANFDFSSAVAAAQEVVNRSEGNSGSTPNYTYPLVYPQAGHTITVRLLFNPKSGQIVRLVNRHEKTACYRTYGIECPICKTMQQVKDMTGQDPFGRSKASKSRGVAFAQYISSTNAISKGENKGNIQQGEIILLMFPWSVYQQINSIIQAVAQTPTGMDQAFSHAQSGLFINITASSEFKYTTTQVPYMTFPSQQTDDDFMKMLEGMESLSDQVLPSTITEEVDKQVREYTDAIYRQYVAPRVPNQNVAPQVQNFSQTVAPSAAPQTPQVANTTPPFSGGYVVPGSTVAAQPPAFQPYTTPAQETPYAPATGTASWASNQPQAPAAPTVDPNAKPACFGQHESNSPKCICCPCEVQCMQPIGGTLPV